jgi:hypothetical protein
MPMEHRCSPRQPLHLEALIEHNGQDRLTGYSCNLSRSGLFVHTGGASPPRNALVWVSLRPWSGSGWTPPAEAMVIHADDGGLGLLLLDSESFLAGVLLGLLGESAQEAVTPAPPPRRSLPGRATQLLRHRS